MCIIIVGNRESILSADLPRLWRSNPHGAGIGYLENRKIKITKGIIHLSDLIKVLKRSPSDIPLVLHLRLATHGSISRGNTHPHRMGRSWLFHNGVLSHFGRSGTSKDSLSDSADLARSLGRISHSDQIKILSSLSGKYAILSHQGIEIVNRDQWVTHGDLIASNAQIESMSTNKLSREWILDNNRDWTRHDWYLPE